MIAVLNHELRTYFHSLTAYVFGAFLLLVVGIGSMLYNISAAVSNFEYVLDFSCIAFAVIVPILTMRTIAEERKLKTDQLLYTLPISTTEVVLGKFFALLIVYLVPLCIISIYPLIFAQFGEVFLPASYGSILAFFALGAALIALGVFISSLTENQGFAAGIGVAVILFNYYSVSLAEYVSTSVLASVITLVVLIALISVVINKLTSNENLAYGTGLLLLFILVIISFVKHSALEGILPAIMKQLSLFDRFDTFVNGIFDVSAFIFYITVIIFFLFLTVQSLEKRRYN